ncbi:MAG: HAD-IIB family hydrolase [Aestuariibacter sp.]
MQRRTFLIFTDLDGTLLDHHTYSYDAALPVLRELQKQDHVIIPNTSKTFAELSKFCQQIPMTTPFVVENGAAAYVSMGHLPNQPAGATQFGEFWRKSFTKEKAHWLALLNAYGEEFRDCYTGFSAMTLQQIADETSLSLADAKLATQRQFGEPLLWHGTKQQLTKFEKTLTAAGATILQGGRFVHVCGQCDKGSAMQWLLDCFVDAYPDIQFTSVALGDSGNDTAMLEAADIAIQIRAPERPFPKINKKQHLYQSTLCGPEGWAETLSSLILHPSRGGF